MRKLSSIGAAFAIAATLSGLAACASGARSENMTASLSSVPAVAAGQPGYKAFRVGSVTGGSETNPLWASNVSSAEFKTALESSLKSAGHLADDPASAQYEITAQMGALNRPMAGLDLTVATSVDYRAASVAGGPALFDKKVAATGTARFGDHLIAVERLRIANEAAVRANIESFISRLREVLGTETASTSKPVS
jgi:hypothetical protein